MASQLMNVSINADLRRYITEKIDSGQFADENEVIHAALNGMRDQETVTADDITELRAELGVGIAELDRGRGEEWDVDEIKSAARRASGRQARSIQRVVKIHGSTRT
ncbi:MAG: hypothetical protein IID33_13185 [Planctomycetes bacterium]|nr:hypothetical protein [Planctomycetota bacterium]